MTNFSLCQSRVGLQINDLSLGINVTTTFLMVNSESIEVLVISTPLLPNMVTPYVLTMGCSDICYQLQSMFRTSCGVANGQQRFCRHFDDLNTASAKDGCPISSENGFLGHFLSTSINPSDELRCCRGTSSKTHSACKRYMGSLFERRCPGNGTN
jgi:hypothetical protein